MKIDSYAIGMSSSTVSVKSYSATETTSVNLNAPNSQSGDSGTAQGQGGNGAAALLMLSPEGQAQGQSQEQAQAADKNDVKHRPHVQKHKHLPLLMQDKDQMKLMLLERLMSALTGKTFRFKSLDSLRNDMPPQQQEPIVLQPIQQPEITLRTERVETYYESQQMSFKAQGVVNTSDGRQISFDLNLFSSYEFSTSTSVAENMSLRLADPLIINFDGTLPEFTKDRYAFDITIDGGLENIFMPTNGSGFLALDKNGNGEIDDGSELFGAATGDGFWELMAHDDDGNGWIDENDAVFDNLKIMFVDKDTGEQTLISLKDAGVGAIFLGSTSANYELKADGNETAGIVRKNGIFLNENGTAGTIHHIDLTY